MSLPDITTTNITKITANEFASGGPAVWTSYVPVEECTQFISAVIWQRNILFIGLTVFFLLMVYLEFKDKIKKFFKGKKEREELKAELANFIIKKQNDVQGDNDRRGQIPHNDNNIPNSNNNNVNDVNREGQQRDGSNKPEDTMPSNN